MPCTRTFVLPLVSLNAVFNVYLLYRVIDGWVRLSSDAESEWEGGGQYLARSLSAIFVAYLLLATTAAAIGFHGVYKQILSSVRLYIQFLFSDFAMCAISLVAFVFNCYNSRKWRDNLCEDLSTHPDILRALRIVGYDIESCEGWIEKLVFGGLSLLGFILVLKLQFTLAVASYYTSIAKAKGLRPAMFSGMRLPSRRPSSRRDRHQGVAARTSDLPPYSDSPSVSTTNLSLGPGAAKPLAYEMEIHSSGEDTPDAKRRA